jgi:hypothetical protein
MKVTGGCLCKTVRYEVEVPLVRFVYCHCSRCRKATGAAHAANGFARPESFRWTSGEHAVKRYDLPEAKRFGLQFCAHCGSKVPHLTRDGVGIVIPAGSLDDDPGTAPQRAIYWGSRAPWFKDNSELPRHDTMPE